MSSERNTKVVWLVNKGGHDYKDLERFGRIIPLTTGNINPFNPDRLMVSLGQQLKMAHPEDYLAISGSPILNMLAMAMWLRKYPEVQILQHSTRKNEYVFLRVTNGAIDQNLIGD
jgi:hypothetical protein